MRLAAILLLFLTAAAAAGPHGEGRQGEDRPGERHIERLTDALQLDDAQVSEVQAILQGAHERMRALHESAGTRRDEMRAIHDDTRAQLGNVLTGEQLRAFDELHEEHRQKMRDHHDHHHDKGDKAGEEVQL